MIGRIAWAILAGVLTYIFLIVLGNLFGGIIANVCIRFGGIIAFLVAVVVFYKGNGNTL
jgi:hypothetical protein